MRKLRVLLVAGLVAACSDSSGPSGTPQIVLSPLLDSLFVGDTLPPGTITATFIDANGDTQPAFSLRWRSSDTSVLTVDSVNGRAVGRKKGAAVLEARASGVLGQALLVVSKPVDVVLLLDTIYLMPGDTMTIPVQVIVRTGPPPAAWFEPSQTPASFTVDSATGLVTALSAGLASRIIVHADSVADSGGVEVRVVSGLSSGRAYYNLWGILIGGTSAEPRATHYFRDGDTLTFRLNASTPNLASANERVVVTLRSAVTAPGTFAIDSLSPDEAFGAGQDRVCRPLRNWGQWETVVAGVGALSRIGGTITVTTVDTMAVDTLAISGRFQFDAQYLGFYDDPLGVATVRGTFVTALVPNVRPC